LSFIPLRKSGRHKNNKESLLFTKTNGDDYDILERIPSLPSGLYYIHIKPVPRVAYKVIFQNVDAFQIWHDRLGHPGVGMMRKIIDNCIGHNLTKIFLRLQLEHLHAGIFVHLSLQENVKSTRD
jgi:hypothetical protein